MSQNEESRFLNAFNEHHSNNLLIAYQQAIQSYEELHRLIQQPQQLTSSIRTELMIDVCTRSVQTLINSEFDNTVYDDFQSDIWKGLILLRNSLVNINKQPPQYPPTGNAVLRTNANPASQLKNSTTENCSFHELMKTTRLVPQVGGLDDIAGLADVKKELMSTVLLPLRQPQLFQNKKVSNSILLYGPPGTGKTRLTHALAAEASACLFSVTSSDILSQFVGQSEKMLGVLFKMVKEPRDSVTILFMDEIDGLCRRRSTDEADWTRRLKTELMCQLSSIEDCRNMFFICSTNCPWDLDTAFIRRFQQRIYIPLPSRPDRFELLQLLTKDTPLEMTTEFWGPLLHRTEGYSGSDLTDLVRNAFNKPITELIDNQIWRMVGNNVFTPVTESSSVEELTVCKLSDLPAGSVQARLVQWADLMTAAEVVKPTVSDEDVQKFREFM